MLSHPVYLPQPILVLALHTEFRVYSSVPTANRLDLREVGDHGVGRLLRPAVGLGPSVVFNLVVPRLHRSLVICIRPSGTRGARKVDVLPLLP